LKELMDALQYRASTRGGKEEGPEKVGGRFLQLALLRYRLFSPLSSQHTQLCKVLYKRDGA